MGETLAAAWNRFWYTPSSARLLGVQRAVFYGIAWLTALNIIECPWAPPQDWAQLDPMFWSPTINWQLLSTSPPSPEFIALLAGLYEVALLTSCLGLMTRTSTVVAGASGYLILTYVNCWGVRYHQTYAVGLILLILAVAPSGEAFSLDSLLSKRDRPDLDARYTWPSRLVWVGLSFVFLAAGAAKLMASGASWIFSDNFSLLLKRGFYFPYTGSPEVDWGLMIAESPILCRTLALTTVALEILYPLGLLAGCARTRWGRRLAQAVPLAMMLSVVGFNVILGRTFYGLVAAHIFWLIPASEPLPPGEVSKRHRLLLNFALGLVVAGSLGAFVLRASPFPFSYYPMYARLLRPEFTRYRIYGVKDSREVPLWDEREKSLAPTNRWVIDIALRRHRTNGKDLEHLLGVCLELARRNGQDFDQLRAYQCTWRIESGAANLRDPQRRLLAEKVAP